MARGQQQPERGFILRNVPNCLTAVTVSCGFILMISVTLGVDSRYCVAAVMTGLVTDVLDGVAARMLDVKSPFGAAFDQLADLTCFGIGPGVFFATTQLQRLTDWNNETPGIKPRQYWTLFAGFCYVLASVVRISRALIVHNGSRPTHFVGIPTNLAAFILVPTVGFFPRARALPWLVLALSFLMVSTFRIPKGLGIIDTEKKKYSD